MYPLPVSTPVPIALRHLAVAAISSPFRSPNIVNGCPETADIIISLCACDFDAGGVNRPDNFDGYTVTSLIFIFSAFFLRLFFQPVSFRQHFVQFVCVS